MSQWLANNMEQVLDFSNILNASIAASWMVLAVIVLRFLLKKVPRWTHVALWGLVAVRLLLPFSIESAFSLIPSAETVPQEILVYEGEKLQDSAFLDIVSNPAFSQSVTVEVGETVDRVQVSLVQMTPIWIAGMVVLLVYTAVSYWHLRRKVSEAVILRSNIFQSENVASPFVLGIIKPRIYLPYHMGEQDIAHVIAHEQAHICRKDHWWKPLGFLLLTIHWFNPLMWLAYVLLCRDIELACDEKVIKELGNEQRADYTQALVACSVNRRMIAACPLAFGEVGVKERVKSVMNYKKPAFWVIVLAVIACIVVAVCFLTNPEQKPKTLLGTYYSVAETLYCTDEEYHYSNDEICYSITAGYGLYEKDRGGEWNHIGTIEQYDLRDGEIKDYTGYDDGWQRNYRWGQIKESYILRLPEQDDYFYMALLTNRGDILLAYGWEDLSERWDGPSDDTGFKWLYRLTPQTSENVLCVKIEDHQAGATQEPRYNIFDLRPFDGEGVTLPGVYTAMFVIDEVEDGVTHVAFDSPLYQDGYETHGLQMKAGESLTLRTSLSDEYTAYTFSIISMADAEKLISIGNDANITTNVTKWFDYLKVPEEMHWDGRLEINLPDFPDVTFRWYPEKMEAVTEEGITSLYTGMPIWNTYFCDLSGDGLPELCSTISWGSGMIDNRVMIYDYANGVSYSLEDRGVSDYTLRQDESDGQLYVDKTAHMGGGLLSTGRLVFEDDCLQVLWPEKPNDGIREITDPTDDPNFAYDTAVEKIFEDTNNEYFIGGLYSQNIIVHYNDGTQEDIVTALNSGKATFADMDRFGIRYWAEPKIDPLETAISSAILDHYASKQPDGRLHVESHVLLANEVKSGTPLMGADNHIKEVTVYLLVFHEKYSTYGGALEAVGGSYVPTAITFSVSESEEYTLKEYWEPRDGSYYAKDVQAKFPGSSAEDALNDQAYIEDLQAQNYSKALAYLNSIGGLELRIAELLDTICASPGVFASSPAQYIEAHEAEYQELLGYREYTLRFCFSEFLRGGQTDLRSHIMRAAIDDIAPEAQLRLYAETGQAYFDEWKAAALRVSAQHEMEWIEKNQPAIYLLLQMLDSEMVADADAGVPQMSFAGLQYGDAMIDEEYIEIQADGTTLEYQITYSSASIILEIGLIAEDGTEMIHMIESGSAKGKFEDIPVGKYQLFVRNVGYQNDLFGKAVEGGALVCKFDYGT